MEVRKIIHIFSETEDICTLEGWEIVFHSRCGIDQPIIARDQT